MSSATIFVAVLLALAAPAHANCTDLTTSTFSQVECFESITCKTSTYSSRVSLCPQFGSSVFTSITTWLDCSPTQSTILSVVSTCSVYLLAANYCYTNNSAPYASTTFSYSLFPSDAVASCNYPPLYYEKVVSFRTGVVGTVTATAAQIQLSSSTGPTSSTSSTPISGEGNTNLVAIIVGVGAAVVVVIVIVVIVIVLRNRKKKSAEQPVPQTFGVSGVPAGYYQQPGQFYQPPQSLPGYENVAVPFYVTGQPNNYNGTTPLSPNEENAYISENYLISPKK
ncbi:hypothetical protein HK096_006729 [Nowakowskiella sp. JEL0078]|nr:hypothetical protein HK096_006729 [Nowakowskiella sp. JEL0078]